MSSPGDSSPLCPHQSPNFGFASPPVCCVPRGEQISKAFDIAPSIPSLQDAALGLGAGRTGEVYGVGCSANMPAPLSVLLLFLLVPRHPAGESHWGWRSTGSICSPAPQDRVTLGSCLLVLGTRSLLDGGKTSVCWGPRVSEQPGAPRSDGHFLGLQRLWREGSGSLSLHAAALGMLLVYLIRGMQK